MDGDASYSFASLLKAHRLARGLTQEALAERAGLSRDAIGLLERGLRLSPRRDTVALLASALQLSGDARARLLVAASEKGGRPAEAAPVGSARHASLPLPLSRFVGRGREIAAATEWLATSRLLTVTGPPGTGKTRLAIELATRLRDRFDGGVFFVPLAGIGDPRRALPAIAQALDVKATPGRSPLESLLEALRDARALLVLDNFEHVLDAAPSLATLLTHGAHLRIVVTSRAALRLSGERELPLSPLEIPAPTASFAEVSRSEAVELFVARVQSVRPDFALTERNAATVGAICRHLDGLPLALELAAGRSRLFPPRAMLARLRERLPLLRGGARDAPARHQTLRAAIAWSYDLLDAAEQALFRSLGVFAGGFTLETLGAVAADGDAASATGDLLESLVAQSLVRWAEQPDGTPRFTLLETLRDFALEQAAGGELAELRDRHAAWFLSLAEESEPLLWGPRHAGVVARLERDYDNLRAALRWLRESADIGPALRLGGALQKFWVSKDRNAEGRDELAALLELPSASNDRAALASVRQGAGILAFYLGDLPSARAHLERAIDLWRALGDRRHLATSVVFLGCVARNEGDLAHAVSWLEEGLGLGREAGNREAEGFALYELGGVARDQGAPRRARSFLEASLAVFADPGYAEIRAGVVHDLGLVAAELDDDGLARSSYRESLTASIQVGDRLNIASTLESFAELAAKARRPARALRLLGAAARVREEISAPVPPTLRARCAEALESACGQLSPDVAAKALAEGRTMPWREASAYALADEDGPSLPEVQANSA